MHTNIGQDKIELVRMNGLQVGVHYLELINQ